MYLMGNYHALIISNKLPPPTPLKTTSARPLRGWAGAVVKNKLAGGGLVSIWGVAGHTILSYGKFFTA